MSSLPVKLANAPINFMVGLQGLPAQSRMEAELVAAAMIMKGLDLCSNTMNDLGFGKRFNFVPVYIDRQYFPSAFAGNHTFSSRLKHVTLR